MAAVPGAPAGRQRGTQPLRSSFSRPPPGEAAIDRVLANRFHGVLVPPRHRAAGKVNADVPRARRIS